MTTTQGFDQYFPAIHPDVLKRVLTLILAGGKGQRLYPLTRDRTKPAVPFGGTFRIIDFTLSNTVNSGLRRICVLTQYKATSLVRHITNGWNIFAGELGEFVYAISPQLRVSDHWYLGTVDAVYQNLYTVEQEKPEHVLILSGDHIYRMDYRAMLAQHVSANADLTLAYTPMPACDAHRFGVIDIGPSGRVVRYREKPEDIPPSDPLICANMGIFVFRTEVLTDVVNRDAQTTISRHDFGYDIIPKMLAQGARIVAHEFQPAGEKKEVYWRDIGTCDAYYEANMDLVEVSPRFSLYDATWPIRSGAIQAPPAKFVFAGGEENRVGQAHDSLVSPGAIVSGGHVSRSIIGPRCRVNSWARVESSILMDEVNVGRRAVVRRAIVDKGVAIPEGMSIGVDRAADERLFTITESGLVIVPRGQILGG